ncbi:splicing factor 3b subunit 4 [Penicillium hispanicum]|uniref:splicing factor 3b subunit 4 n=1 Tax=Penicillium hispanicum TaxID=1080232 RepID=UPI002542672A|nr:splicing factor 3b subunit 4 [Penicillium hispanicum]KAJ5570364.1 splicing factor 3b subunit 4 [Penicillium hispanicum]
MSGARHWEQDKEATVYIGNLDERASDSLVWELMLQAGRIVNVHLPKDRVTQLHQGYGFVEFISEEDAEYASRIMNGIRLFGKPIRVNKASADKQKSVEIGAELFVGNLDPMVSEQVLYDTFSRFGNLVNFPKVRTFPSLYLRASERANGSQIARDDNNLSKGYGFVSFADFESSDAAIANMNGQYLMNKQVSVQYAYKKDGKGERHGDEAERMLAAQARKHNVRPPTQQIPSAHFTGVGSGSTPTVPNSDGSRQVSTGPQTPDLSMGRAMPAPGTYQSVPPPQSRPPPTSSLATPPPGLPARPPPSQAGYGGPQSFLPPGLNGANQQQPFTPQSLPPPGFVAPGFGPAAGVSGGPPPLPPGFQQPGYGPGR